MLGDNGAPQRAEVEAELQRILSAPDLVKNRGASSFLKFVVEETLAGRGDRLKAFTIATMVFARDASFDAQSNSAVRVQAMRLRALLQSYYAEAGAGNPVRIVLRTGSYRPAFVRVGDESPPQPEWPATQAFPRRRVAALAALAMLICALALWLSVRPAAPPASEAAEAPPVPTLVVERPDPPPAGPGGAYAARLLDLVETELGASDNLTISKSAAAQEFYALTLRPIPVEDGRFDLAFELLRQPAAVLVWSKNFPAVDIADAAQMRRISHSLSQTVGDAYGVVDLDAIRHLTEFDGVPRGFNCTLCAFAFMKNQTMDRLRVARECLELAVKAHPRDAGATSLLAILLANFYVYGLPENQGEDDLLRAGQLAQAAYDLAPDRARSSFALFVTRFYAKRFDDGFRLGRKALEINPDSWLFARAVGSAWIARADYDQGLALLAPVEQDAGDASAAVASVALADYMRENFAAVADLLGRPGAGDRALGLTLQIALCQKQRDIACARRAAASLRLNFPGVARDMDAAFERAGFADPIRRKLLDDLTAAGFFSGGGE